MRGASWEATVRTLPFLIGDASDSSSTAAYLPFATLFAFFGALRERLSHVVVTYVVGKRHCYARCFVGGDDSDAAIFDW
jgi:hypothetical protein